MFANNSLSLKNYFYENMSFVSNFFGGGPKMYSIYIY